MLTAGALLPALFALFDLPEALIWRASAVLFSLPMLALQTTYPIRRRNVAGKGPPLPIIAVFVVLGSAVTLAMLAYELAAVRYTAAVYIAALTIDFFTVVFAYVVALDVIMREPVDAPDQPAKR